MRFASCEAGGERFAALVEEDRAIPLDGVRELGAHMTAEQLARPSLSPRRVVPLDEVRLRPVVPRPGKIICLGLNYRTHVDETKRDLPDYPVLFTKFPESLVGPFDDIVKPPESAQVDYEAELAVVIGRRVRRAAEADALAAVAGYAVANDVTMRDYQYRSHQWLQGKTWPASTPLGPFLVTPDEVGDPATLDISLERNGVELQRREHCGAAVRDRGDHRAAVGVHDARARRRDPHRDPWWGRLPARPAGAARAGRSRRGRDLARRAHRQPGGRRGR